MSYVIVAVISAIVGGVGVWIYKARIIAAKEAAKVLSIKEINKL